MSSRLSSWLAKRATKVLALAAVLVFVATASVLAWWYPCRPRMRIEGNESPIAVSPDGKLLIVGVGQSARGTPDRFGEPLRVLSIHPGNLSGNSLPLDVMLDGYLAAGATFSPDGRHLAVRKVHSAKNDWKIDVIDVASRQLVGTIDSQPQCGLYQCQFSPDGRTLAIDETGRRSASPVVSEIILWDVLSRRGTMPVGKWLLSFCFLQGQPNPYGARFGGLST